MPICMEFPPLVCMLRKPKIYWYQTDGEVVMRIILNEVMDYFLRVQVDDFEFSTTLGGTDYYVYLELFGAIIAKCVSHTETGREITVRLPKVHKFLSWPRLLRSTEKVHQIEYDIDRLESITLKQQPHSYVEREDFTSFKKRHNITHIMPDVPSSTEEDSDDEEFNIIFET
ncbi:putative ATP-dependent RNA helicase TDRD12 [Athalia rosae]|uniref:putative ATP-dependent RNA helicase TDRD12 n=1 Tax=Athalia rosae TaxID=37344 RepID=UPI0006252171|nr:putative ATP-dependent RNA helicase TDRD12 [Athalia rosae]